MRRGIFSRCQSSRSNYCIFQQRHITQCSFITSSPEINIILSFNKESLKNYDINYNINNIL